MDKVELEREVKKLKEQKDILRIKELNNSKKNNRLWLKTGVLDQKLLAENKELFKKIQEINHQIYELNHRKMGLEG